ncbi:MAG: altronate dehydratase [Lachnospiraceae bacterium]|nr:altronate dehydratase [Lachnospiraceae bacterium]
MERRYLIVDSRDSVAVLLENAKKGDFIDVDGRRVFLRDDIDQAHKVALTAIKKGSAVIKYGQEIGRILEDVPEGTWIHDHNMGCERGRTERSAKTKAGRRTVEWTGPRSGQRLTFMGYRRPYGGVGVRNHIAVISNVFCANTAAEKIARSIPGAVLLRHNLGCGQIGFDLELTARTLKSMGEHPNVGAVIIVALGCERLKAQEVYDDIVSKTGKPCALFVIQEEGGMDATVEKAIAKGLEFAELISNDVRTECDLSELFLTTKCGGTDSNSGLAANPAVGYASDCVVSSGGSSVISELNELIGTEDYLASRAVNEEVEQKIYDAVYGIEDFLKGCLQPELPAYRNQLISPGNFTGGVSSIVEKALGGVHKCGTAPIEDVLDYALPPKPGQKGLYLMSYESVDGEVTTGMVGCGSQIVCFTTGRGNPTGHPIAPVIKITGNHEVYEKLKDDFDFDASPITREGKSVKEVGEELFDLILRVANGELTSAERHGGEELFCMPRRHGIQMQRCDDIQGNYLCR